MLDNLSYISPVFASTAAVLLPFFAFLAQALAGKRAKSGNLGLFAIAGSTILSLFVFANVWNGAAVNHRWEWFAIGKSTFHFGILLNNRMFDFSPKTGQPNSVAAGVRPAHTLNPWLIGGGASVHMAGVSPGGISQTTTGFQLIKHALMSTSPLGEVVASPRWSLSRAGEVLLEPGMETGLATRLRTRGHDVVENSDHEFYFGSAKLLRRTPQGWLEAAADARRQATALAW